MAILSCYYELKLGFEQTRGLDLDLILVRFEFECSKREDTCSTR